MSDLSGSDAVMSKQHEADTVWRNLHSDANQVADYLVARCGDFMYDHERAALIAAFLRAASQDPPAVSAETFGLPREMQPIVDELRRRMKQAHS